LRAEATGFNDVAAFDDAIKSIELQIRKIHERDKSHDRASLRTMKVDLSE
jgi:ribosome-associated translation inhibitor RaiA